MVCVHPAVDCTLVIVYALVTVGDTVKVDVPPPLNVVYCGAPPFIVYVTVALAVPVKVTVALPPSIMVVVPLIVAVGKPLTVIV